MLIIGEKARSNDIIYGGSYNCSDQFNRQIGQMDLIQKLRTVSQLVPLLVGGVQHPVYKRRFRPRGLSRRKRLEVVVEKPDKPLPFETPFVRTGARGRLLAETQNRFSQKPWPALPPFLSIPYLFTPFFPLFPERWTRLFPLFPPPSPAPLFLPSPFYSEFRECTCAFTYASSDQTATRHFRRAFKLTGP